MIPTVVGLSKVDLFVVGTTLHSVHVDIVFI